jgi:hypothetical protein
MMATRDGQSIRATVLTSQQPVKAYRIGRVCQGLRVRIENGQLVEEPCDTMLSRYNSAAYCSPCQERRFSGADRSSAAASE